MFTALLVLAALGYLNIGYNLTSKEKSKLKIKDWHKFNSSWILLMLVLPVSSLGEMLLSAAFFPALRRHNKRIKEVEAQRELDAEEYPKFLVEGEEGADRAAKGIPDPVDPASEPELSSTLNEVLNPAERPKK